MLEVDFSGSSDGIITFAVHGTTEIERVRAGVRHLVDSSCPVAALESFADEPLLRPLQTRWPGIRIPGTLDPFELAVRAVIGQQISVRGAASLASRVTHEFGTALAQRSGSLAYAFPSPAELVDAGLEQLGLPARRAAAIRDLSARALDGRLSFDEGSHEALREGLLAIKGVGPWTAEYVSLRGGGWRDALPVADLGLRQAATASGRGAPISRSELESLACAWRPLRGYAAILLWTRLLFDQ